MKLNLKFETMLDNIRSGKLSFEDIRNEVDRKSVVQGKSVDLGGRRSIKKKKRKKKKKEKKVRRKHKQE